MNSQDNNFNTPGNRLGVNYTWILTGDTSLNPNAPGGNQFTRNRQNGALQAHIGPVGQLEVPSHSAEYNTRPPSAEPLDPGGTSMPKLPPRERSKSLGMIQDTAAPLSANLPWAVSGAPPWHSSPATPRHSMHQPVPKLDIESDDAHATLEFDNDEDMLGMPRPLRTGNTGGPSQGTATQGSSTEPYMAAPGFNYRSDPRFTIDFMALRNLDYQECRDIHFYHPGRVFIVSPKDKDIHLASRTMMVLAVSDHGAAVCLSLCNHPDVSGREDPKFFHSHVRITEAGSPQPRELNPIQRRTIQIRLREDLQDLHLMGSVWINCQHPWTVQCPRVAVADAGYMERSERMKLKVEYLDVQNRMLDADP